MHMHNITVNVYTCSMYIFLSTESLCNRLTHQNPLELGLSASLQVGASEGLGIRLQSLTCIMTTPTCISALVTQSVLLSSASPLPLPVPVLCREVWDRFVEFESSVGDLASLLKVEKRRAAAMRADSRQVSPTIPGLCASVSDTPGYHILLVHSVITHSFDEVGLAI